MSGSSGIGIHSVARDSSAAQSAADDQNISSLLGGAAWNGATITYSFPTSSGQYGTQTSYGDADPFTGFSQLDSSGHSGQKVDVQRAFSLIASYTNLTFTQITESISTHATVRFANAGQSAVPTSEAFLPSNAPAGGDVFFGATGQNPVMGNFDSGQAILHEIGHALGLKHGQDRGAYGTMNADRLDIEFSLMNYANYIGSAEGYATSSTSAQSYMMYDIAALQYMYGANFNQVGHNNTYTWSSSTGTEFVNGASLGTPYNGHIFETIWTAGATSTYDLSNFSQNQVDDMNPGGWMLFSTSQLADLNFYAPSKPSGEIFARGDVYNALQYNGDARSLITNIVTGPGADTITGNAADNTIKGGGGNDTIDGGAGTDTAVFSGPLSAYTLTAFGTNGIHVAGPDGNDTLTNIERLAFDDQTITWPPTGTPVAPTPPVVATPPVVPTGPQLHLATTTSIGAHPAGWLPTATGDFNHDGTSDLVWFNATTRDLDLWKISNGQWSGSVDLGTHPAGYQPSASGDFNHDGTSDLVWFNATTRDLDLWKISNGQWSGSIDLGTHPAGYQPSASGDFNGDGVSDVLWYNATNGDAEVWKIANGQWAGSVDIGSHPLGWQPVATGDFDHDGTSDVLWYNPATRDLDLWKVSNGHWAGSVDIGTHPAGYAPIGAGDFNGDGTSDVAWFNAASGDVEVWLIANGHWAASVDLGAHAAGWSPAGIGDFNGDHISDIAWREASTGHLETWLLAYS